MQKMGVHVAVAEDNGDMRRLLADVLRKEGHSVIELEDGAALWREVGEPRLHAIDLIVSDIRMPMLTGLSVLRSLRAGGSALPVILMTAFGDEETKHEVQPARRASSKAVSHH